MKGTWVQAITAVLGAVLGLWILYFILFEVLPVPLELGRYLLFVGTGLTSSSLVMGFRVHLSRKERETAPGRRFGYVSDNKLLLSVVFLSWMFGGWTLFLSGMTASLQVVFWILGSFVIVFSHFRIDARIRNRVSGSGTHGKSPPD